MQSKVLAFLYLVVGLVPYFGTADKVDSQVLYLNILNSLNIVLLIISNKKNYISLIQKSIGNMPFLFMGLFFLWSCITIFPAINKVESLISLSEIFTILISLFFLIFHFNNIDKLKIKSYILFIVVIITSLELISIYTPYISDIINNGKPSFQSIEYRGISGNINVMSYSLLLKLPFLVYFFIRDYKSKNIIFILIFLTSYAIINILQTRSAILSLILISILLCSLFYLFFKEIKISTLFKKILFPISLGLILSFIPSSIENSVNVQDRMGTLLNPQEDTSINERLRYYKAAIRSFVENPIFGIGVGNWEIESVKYDRKNMDDYIVPYHAHNDYLEILAESGILAPILYFGILLIILFIILKKQRNLDNQNQENIFLISIFSSICVYLLDSMFNFPQARILSQMNLIFLLTISTLFINLNFSLSSRVTKIICITIIPLTILSMLSSIRVFESSKDQMILLRQFNTNDFSKPSLDIIEKMQNTYPNVTATGLPIATHQGLHFLKNDSIKKSIKFFEQALPYNPYLMITETFLGYSYDQINEHEKGLYYTKLAFDKAPNDIIHFGNYLNSLYEYNDSTAIKEAYLKVPEKFKKPLHDELYLIVSATMKNPSSSNFTLDGLNINYQAGNDRLKKGYYFSQVGQNNTYNANLNYLRGMYLFEQENYTEAIKYFLNASELNPYELVYLENAANSYLRLGNDNAALDLLNKLVNEFNAESPKVFYLRGLILYDIGKTQEACEDFKIANNSGMFGSSSFFKTYCN